MLRPWPIAGARTFARLRFQKRYINREIAGSLNSGAKVLVFSQFTTFLDLLKKRIKLEIPDLEVLELTGSPAIDLNR